MTSILLALLAGCIVLALFWAGHAVGYHAGKWECEEARKARAAELVREFRAHEEAEPFDWSTWRW